MFWWFWLLKQGKWGLSSEWVWESGQQVSFWVLALGDREPGGAAGRNTWALPHAHMTTSEAQGHSPTHCAAAGFNLSRSWGLTEKRNAAEPQPGPYSSSPDWLKTQLQPIDALWQGPDAVLYTLDLITAHWYSFLLSPAKQPIVPMPRILGIIALMLHAVWRRSIWNQSPVTPDLRLVWNLNEFWSEFTASLCYVYDVKAIRVNEVEEFLKPHPSIQSDRQTDRQKGRQIDRWVFNQHDFTHAVNSAVNKHSALLSDTLHWFIHADRQADRETDT